MPASFLIVKPSATFIFFQPDQSTIQKTSPSVRACFTEDLGNMADSDEEGQNVNPVLASLSQISKMVRNTIEGEKERGRMFEAGARKVAPISAVAYLSTIYNIIQGGLDRGITCNAIYRVVQAGTYVMIPQPTEQQRKLILIRRKCSSRERRVPGIIRGKPLLIPEPRGIRAKPKSSRV